MYKYYKYYDLPVCCPQNLCNKEKGRIEKAIIFDGLKLVHLSFVTNKQDRMKQLVLEVTGNYYHSPS